MIQRPTRAALQRAFPNAEPFVILALDALFGTVDSVNTSVTTGADATQALQDATVLTLSPNDAFTNERVVAAGNGIRLTDTGSQLVISLLSLIINGGGRLSINLGGDAQLTVIQSGTVMVEEAAQADLVNYADAAAASAAGLPSGSLFRTGEVVKVVP